MSELTRRAALKQGGQMLLGGALVACSEQESDQHDDAVADPTPHRTTSATEHDLFDRGAVPIASSGWAKAKGLRSSYRALEADLSTSVLVIGAGLAGASLALHLSEQGIDTVVLEARQPGWGASGRNAGHVLPLLKDFSVIEQFPDHGNAFIELFREQHTIPFDIAEKYAIECDAARSGYLNSIKTQSSFDKFSQSAAKAASRLGQRITSLGADEMREMTGSDYYPYGVFYESGGRINPYLFTCGMIEVAQTKGARIFGDTVATAVLPDGNGWLVRVQNGASVRCDKLVFCTNAYTSDIVPEFQQGCYPMTAYALATEPLPADLRNLIMPSRATLAQVPVDLNPFIVDEHDRIITASIPSNFRPADAQWHFQQHLDWIHRTWPAAKEVPIKLESYWTGRVAMRNQEFPGAYRLASGIYGLMHFNAWGNVMAPLLGRELAKALVSDRPDTLPFPLVQPDKISYPGKQELIIRGLMIPAARIAQSMGII